jgi:Holliday junction resolvase RusA-like endonuclease
LIEIRLDGDPVAKGRHRSKFMGMRTDEAGKQRPVILQHPDARTVRYEDRVAWAAQVEMHRLGLPLLTNALWLELHVYVGVPASWSARKRAQALSGALRPTKKPDLDNFQKAICDALNRIVWVDDSQIVEVLCKKFFDLAPRIEIRVDNLSTFGL